MKRFRFQADTEFDAVGIDDAIAQLAHHFAALEDGEYSGLDHRGYIRIEPTTSKPTAEVESLKADAERYRFMRESDMTSFYEYIADLSGEWPEDDSPEGVDAIIDIARTKNT